jgi:hypothetical protein
MRTLLTLTLLSLLACGDDDGTIVVDAGIDSGATDGGRLDAGEAPDDGGFDAGRDSGTDVGELDAGTGATDAGELDAGELDAGEVDAGELDAGEDAGTDAGDLDAGDAGPPCLEIPSSTDPAVVVMGELSATGTIWMRPEEGETAICEEVAMGDYAYETFTFCEVEGLPHFCLITMTGVDGEGGTLSDPYLFVYPGSALPADRTTCVAENDDENESTLDSYVEVEVPAGGSITIVPSSFDEIDSAESPGVGTYTLTVVCSEPT